MNEAETRAEHIDPALKGAGWGVVEGSRVLREYPITLGRIEGHRRRGKALTADYVLVYRNHKLAVVEAVRYAYSTNGQGIYGIDMMEGTEGEAPRYPGPEELWNLTFAEADAWRDRFAAVPFEDKGGFYQPRYFQDLAIDRALEAIAAGRDRILLTLATGTGKTFIAFQIAWKLFHSRWNLSREPSRRPRILFLADRNILHGAHRPGGHPQERQGAEERQPVLHHLPDLPERAAERRKAFALFRRVSAGFLRLHRGRRVPSRRR